MAFGRLSLKAKIAKQTIGININKIRLKGNPYQIPKITKLKNPKNNKGKMVMIYASIYFI